MVQPIRLIEGITLPNAVAVQYTVPGKTTTILKKVTCQNTDTVNGHVVTIYLVPNGGSPGVTNEVINQKPVGPLQTVDITELQNHVMQAGDTFQAFADDASHLQLQSSGVQIV